MQCKVNFLRGVKQIWIQRFPSHRLVALPRLKSSAYPSVWRLLEGEIHTFLNGICAIWNTKGLVQDLNSVCYIHFLRRQPLYHEQAEYIWICIYCMLTLDRAVNQRFSARDFHVKISGRSQMVERKCVVLMKWYIQITTWDTARESLSLGVSPCGQKRAVSHWRANKWPGAPLEQRFTKRPSTSLRLSKPFSEREAEETLSVALKIITKRGMVKRRSYGSIKQSVFAPPCLTLSHTYRSPEAE